jgi:predicted RNA-binding Zn-ribbon protein involved in translation (DUF1610 family)
MTDQEEEFTTCPECGGEVYREKVTQAFALNSCVDCEWYVQVKVWRYP